MEPIKVVVRYADGKLLKGMTQDFFQTKIAFISALTQPTRRSLLKYLFVS